MLSLNTYITEKLRINKDLKDFNKSFSDGDKVGFFDVYSGNKWDKALQIQLHSPSVIDTITSDELTYITKNGKKLTWDVHTNSHGYCQEDITNEYQGDYRRTIILNKYDSIEFLNGLLKRNIKNVDLLHKYFDDLDIFDFEGSTLEVYDCRDSVIDSIKDKGIKEIRAEYEEI